MAVTTAAVVGAGASVWGAYDDYKSKDDALDAQEDQNDRKQAFIEEQARKARSDVLAIQPHADDARNAGYQSAMDVLTGSLQPRMDVFGDGNVAAQDILGQGFTAQQNAILGLPMEMPGSVRLEPDISSLQNVQLPEFTVPNLLAGIQSTPGQTTNQDLTTQAFNQGLISDQDYAWHQDNFANTPNLADGRNWGNIGNSADLISTMGGSPLTDKNQARMVRLYNALFGGQ